MTIIIPAYKPDEKLPALLRELRAACDVRILVVNDGSGEAFAPIFSQVRPLCDTLLVHEENRGKGAALKTAFAYLLKTGLEKEAICTADADGQHLPGDILRCLKEAAAHPGSLVLGVRAFHGNVPARSRFGNTVSRFTFRLLMGKSVQDTQTGLRAFSPALLPQLLDIPENRYEYEMRMLCSAVRAKIPLRQVEIETVYLNENKSSHLSPARDALRVYGLLIRCALGPVFEILSFGLSSCGAFLVDAVVYFFLLHYLFPLMLANERHVTFCSLLVARVISSTVNFCINGKLVFHQTKKPAKSFVLYLLLVTGIFFVNENINALFYLTVGIHPVLSHILSQLICFPISFLVQKFVVFRKKQKES